MRKHPAPGPHKPVVRPSTPYAIPAARAVVQALMLYDRDAAEAAAMRTCRDCDLLVRLVREIAPMLRALAHGRVSLSPGEAMVLARRVEHVLGLVTAEIAEPSAPEARAHKRRRRPGAVPSERTPDLPASDEAPLPTTLGDVAARTVAALGMRVRLVPETSVPEDEGSATGDDEPDAGTGGAPPRSGER